MNEKVRLFYNEDFVTKYGISMERNVFSSFKAHTHNFYELEYVMRGEGVCLIDGKKYPIRQNSLVFASPANVHEYISGETEIEVMNVHFHEKTLKSYYDLANIDGCVLQDRADMEELFLNAYYEWMNCDKYSVLAIPNTIERIIIQFLRNLPMNNTDNVLSNISSAKNYVKLHFREDISLEYISKRLGYAPAYFSRLFKKEVGVGFHEYLNDIRMDYAKNMLTSQAILISDLYAECGFNSLRSFTRAYKQKFRVAPSQDKM